MDSLKAEENKPDSESEAVEGASQIERLENRIAMISGMLISYGIKIYTHMHTHEYIYIYI